MRLTGWIALSLVLAIIAFAFLLRVVAITVVTPDGANITGTLFNVADSSNIAITGDDATNTITIQSESLSKVKLANQLSDAHWVMPGWACRTNQNFTATQNEVRYLPIAVPQDQTYDSIGISLNVAGAGGEVARLGIYNANLTSTGLQVTTLLLDAGTVDISSTGQKTISINQALPQGYYFLAFVTDTAGAARFASCSTGQGVDTFMSGYSPSFASAFGIVGWTESGVGTGGLPATATPDGSIHMSGGSVGEVRLLE